MLSVENGVLTAKGPAKLNSAISVFCSADAANVPISIPNNKICFIMGFDMSIPFCVAKLRKNESRTKELILFMPKRSN
jgi:hypothetical protein